MSELSKSCPVCDADLVFAGDEKRGDSVLCSSCGSPFVVSSGAAETDDLEIEDDF